MGVKFRLKIKIQSATLASGVAVAGLRNLGVDVAVPEVVDGAAGPAHEEGARGELAHEE